MNNKGFLNIGLVVVFAVALVLAVLLTQSNFGLNQSDAYTYSNKTAYTPVPSIPPRSCSMWNRIFGGCKRPAPIVCEYAAPLAGCQYVPGPYYNQHTQCGLVLNCKSPSPTPCPEGYLGGPRGCLAPSPIAKSLSPTPCPEGYLGGPRGCVSVRSGIAGTVTIGPTCPVIQYPPDGACDDRPYQGDFIVKQASGKQLLMASFSTDADGDYTVNVPPGDYTIQPVGTFLSRQVFAVTVKGDLVIEFNFALDSGIR